MYAWASEGRPWIYKRSAKKVVFFVSNGKKQNLITFSPPTRNLFEKSPRAPPGKNPSDAHGTKVAAEHDCSSFELRLFRISIHFTVRIAYIGYCICIFAV